MCLKTDLKLSKQIEWIKMEINKKELSCPQCGMTLMINSIECLPKYAYCSNCNDYFYSNIKSFNNKDII